MKKKWVKILTAAFTAVLLTGCGGKQEENNTANQQNQTGQEQETLGSEAQTSEDGEETSKLIISTWEADGSMKYFNKLMEEFQKTYPQYEVELIYTDALQYNDKIITMMAGGTECDVVFFKDAASLCGCVEKGQVMALNDWLDKSSLDTASYSGLVEALSRDGNVYGMPYRKDNTLIYYNKDLFDNKGVEYPGDGMTLEEFRETAAKFAGETTYGASTMTWGSLYTVMAARTGKYKLADPDSYDYLIPYYENILAMQDEDKSFMNFAEQVATGDASQWVKGKSAMTWLGTWYTNQIIPSGMSPVDFNWGVCSLPNDAGSVNENGVGSVTPVSVSKYAQNPEGAWKFIEFACGPEGAKILAEDAILSGYTDDDSIEVISSVEGVPEGYGDYLNVDVLYLEVEMMPHSGELGALMDQQNSLIMTGSATIDEAVEEWKTMAKEALAE